MLNGPAMPRSIAATALLATLATAACTHSHQVSTSGPLPQTKVSHGRGALEGMGIGALVGAGTGAVVGLAEGDDPPCGDSDWLCFRFDATDKALILGTFGAGTGALAGLLIGAVVGSRDTYERAPGWVPMISTHAAPGAARASATWSF